MRHVDLTQLPRDKRNYIAWNQAAGFQIPFIYDHLRGEMTILQANKGKHGEAILEIEFESNYSLGTCQFCQKLHPGPDSSNPFF